MPNLAAYRQLIELKKTNAFELPDAPFFVIEKYGRRAYLFGTDHSYDPSTLPIEILDRIKKSDQLFMENCNPTEEEFSAFLQSLRIKNPTQNIWEKILTSEQIASLRRVATDAFNMFASRANEQGFDILELDPAFLLYTVGSFIEVCLESIQVTNRTKEDDATNLMMEAQLAELFDDEPLHLEPYGLGAKGVPQLDDEDFVKLKDEIIPFYDLFIKQDILSDGDRMVFDDLKDKLAHEYNSHKTSYSVDGLLHDFSTASDLDDEVTNFDLNMAIRNLHMFNKIQESISKHTLPLYCVGADHLIGSLGLINILQRNGYTVSRITPTNTPITYSYPQYRKSYNAMKRSILEGPEKCKLRLLGF